MIDGTRTANNSIESRLIPPERTPMTRTASPTPATMRTVRSTRGGRALMAPRRGRAALPPGCGAVDAVADRRHCLQPRRGDGLAAVLAGAVAAFVVDLGQGPVDFGEGLSQG